MTACRVQMLGKWSPDAHLFGLQSDAVTLKINNALFSCCDASGMIVDPDEPKNARMCGLRGRWNLVYRLMAQIPERPDADYFFDCSHMLLSVPRDWSRVSGDPRGRVIFSPERGKFNAAAYYHAVAVSWHLGCVALAARVDDDHLPVQRWGETLDKFRGVRAVMFLQASAEMWVPRKVELMEAAIAFAYERSMPLWIFDPAAKTESASVATPKNFRGAIEEKLRKQKSKSALSWLPPQALSRLQEICEFNIPGGQPSIIPDIV